MCVCVCAEQWKAAVVNVHKNRTNNILLIKIISVASNHLAHSAETMHHKCVLVFVCKMLHRYTNDAMLLLLLFFWLARSRLFNRSIFSETMTCTCFTMQHKICNNVIVTQIYYFCSPFSTFLFHIYILFTHHNFFVVVVRFLGFISEIFRFFLCSFIYLFELTIVACPRSYCRNRIVPLVRHCISFTIKWYDLIRF